MVTDNEIIEAAILVFAHKPNATMSDVAKEAGVTRITVNRKFGSKKDLLKIATNFCIERFEEVFKKAYRADKSALEKLHMILNGFSDLRNHYFFWMRTFVDDNEGNRKIFLRQLDAIEHLVIEAQHAGDIRPDLPSGWVASMLDHMAIASNIALFRGIVAERDIPKVSWDTLLNGISPKKFF